jgi:hypothetical protein
MTRRIMRNSGDIHESCILIMMSETEDETLELDERRVNVNVKIFCAASQLGRTRNPAAIARVQSLGY